MSITAETISTILECLEVPEDLRADPEIQAIAYGFAFMDEPTGAAEERFYDANTVFYDPEGESRYGVPNRDLVLENLRIRLAIRINTLGSEEQDPDVVAAP